MRPACRSLPFSQNTTSPKVRWTSMPIIRRIRTSSAEHMTGAAGDTTTTDSRSRRNRASRRGGQLLTRALGSSCASACPHFVLPVPLSRWSHHTPRCRNTAAERWHRAISYRLPTRSSASTARSSGGPAARRIRALRRGRDGPRDGTSLRRGAPAGELLPAVIQAQREAPRGSAHGDITP
ncbi:hypothetical protein M2209_009098 [Bradyrhizobium elkanii]|nr:hypothetical protein [Bradyrhizobium elkanii]MCP1737676.1 hypothetical protein [Bradyrhizobium elkanii]MCS3576233.1 hypothetical protein [Bradyrhizobium elkanii]MCS3594827.1 hypothetical protein [Bradyrhizobium elkanii]MCS3626021.1 hypothetical protein [Bradyrhizobium elkanii]